MRHTIIAAATIVLLMTQVTWAQKQPPMKPTAPDAGGDPVWQGIVRASDGRTFITDGGLAIDTALAKPASLPARELPGKVLDGQLAAAHKAEYRFSDLRVEKPSRTYASPNGILLNATYIDYLRRILPASSARLRMTGDMQPIVIVADGKAVGVFMPVRK
jgi:hypothetical protein